MQISPQTVTKSRKSSDKTWWSEGIRFQCQGSGKCCVSRGAYGYVYVTLSDRRALAKLFGLPTGTFTRRYCDQDSNGYWKLNEFQKECQFLQDTKCGVYAARPTQCRTWPFWPENMSAKAWSKEVASYCPGVGKGKIWPQKEVQRMLREQTRSENQY